MLIPDNTRRMKLQNWQKVISRWVSNTFGEEAQTSTEERSYRFFEESTELIQATGIPKWKAQQIFDEVYNRPKGEPKQEFGGVFVCLLALAENQKVSALDCLIAESNRIHTPEIIEKCRRRVIEKREKGLSI